MTMRLVPAPETFAPMRFRKSARSTISGSRAALSMTVSPSASTAAIIRFSVPGDRDLVEDETGAAQTSCLRPNVAVFDLDGCAHRAQAGHVQIDGPCTNRTAAGQGHVRPAESPEQRTEDQNGCPHGLDQFIRSRIVIEIGGIDLDSHPVVNRRLDTHAAEQFDGRRHIPQMRHIADNDPLVGQYRRRQDRQRRVLRAGNSDLALETPAAIDGELIHGDRRILPASEPESTAHVSRRPSCRRGRRRPFDVAAAGACRRRRSR